MFLSDYCLSRHRYQSLAGFCWTLTPITIIHWRQGFVASYSLRPQGDSPAQSPLLAAFESASVQFSAILLRFPVYPLRQSFAASSTGLIAHLTDFVYNFSSKNGASEVMSNKSKKETVVNTRDDLEEHIAAFLKAGGKVQ